MENNINNTTIEPAFEDMIEINLDSKWLVKSMYAYFIEKDDGTYIVYSTFNGAVITFTEPEWIERLMTVIENEIIEDNEEDELIVTLKNRKILIDPETDELLLVRMLYEENIIRKDNLHLIMHVSKNCNFNCIYCGQDHENIKMNEETYNATLKFIEVHVKQNRCDKLSISFMGGEPLLEYKQVCSFVEKLKEAFPALPLSLHFTTNAYLLTPERFEKLSSLADITYQITMDGSKEIHDRYRPSSSGKGTWDKILENIRYMLSTKHNFAIILRSNINNEVIDALPEFYDYIKAQFPNEPRIALWFTPIKYYGNALTPDLLTNDEEITSTGHIAGLIKNTGFNCFNLINNNPCMQACSASKPNNYNITYDGKVEKCEFVIGEDYNKIGDLSNNGMIEKANEEVYAKWVYSDFLTEQQCQSCRLLPFCFGKRCPKGKIVDGSLYCNSDDLEQKMLELLKNTY